MAAFDSAVGLRADRAFRLLINTSVTLFWRPQVLDETTAWLTNRNYQVTRLDAAHWEAEQDLHENIARVLTFPDYYGRNLDALNDCMRDVVSQRFGWARAHHRPGRGLHRLRRLRRSPLAGGPDCAGRHGRQLPQRALIGRRLMCLVQSNDPRIRFEPVGATPVAWSDAEWLDANRQSN